MYKACLFRSNYHNEVINMPFGLIFPGILALWLAFGDREKALRNWRINRISALLAIFLTLVLSYVDIPLGNIYLNMGSVFILLFTLWLFWSFKPVQKWRTAIASLVIAVLVFLVHSGLLWQIEQYFSYSEYAAILLCILVAAAARGFRQALVAAAWGVEIAGLANLLIVGSGMGLPYLNSLSLICAGAWLILWIVKYFKRRRLTIVR